MQIVIGLFQSSGIAEDACNRLRTEGVATGDVFLRVMHEIGAVPETMMSELDALSLDPMIFGNARDNYVEYIHNGETGVFVRTETAADIERAGDILRLFEPILVEVMQLQRDSHTAPVSRSRATSSEA